jgi:putative tricarboxylic transport membrane protein
VAQIPPNLLMPGVLVLCIVGAYGDNNNLFDVWVMLGAGVLGYLMRAYDYEPAPLVLGLVLGPIMERSLLQALTMEQGNIAGLWASPIAAVILFLALLAAAAPLSCRLRPRVCALFRRPCAEPALAPGGEERKA